MSMDIADWQVIYKLGRIIMIDYELEYRNPPAGFLVENNEKIFLWNIVHRGEIFWEYYLDHTGRPWSTKSGSFKRMSVHVGGNSPYPKTGFSFGARAKRKTIEIHRLVCETFHEIPLPKDVTEQEWADTPESVKKHFAHYWQVNHINHVHTDFHPDNLEWVSGRENVDKYHEYRLAA